MPDMFILIRTAAEWTASNPTLLANQLGVESDVKNNVQTAATKAKLGDGSTPWNSLGYWSPNAKDGDVVGPASAVDGDIAVFDGITGKLIKDGGSTIAGLAGSNNIGYLNIPQNSQSVDYTLVLGDAGKCIYETGASKTITIPANASVAFTIGTAVTFIATDAGGCSIAITSDTLTLAGTTSTGTRTLAQNGMATAVKVTATSWLISGTGLT